MKIKKIIITIFTIFIFILYMFINAYASTATVDFGKTYNINVNTNEISNITSNNQTDISLNAIKEISTNSTGTFATVHQPPTGWNPLTASVEELTYFGYPQKPKDSDQLARWEKVASCKWVAPTFGKAEPLNGPKPVDPLVNSGNSSPNLLQTNVQGIPNIPGIYWSGYAELAQTTGVHSYWIVPDVTSSTTNLWENQDSAEWVGLGGFTSQTSPLAQIGTLNKVVVNPSGLYCRDVVRQDGSETPLTATQPVNARGDFSVKFLYAK